MSDKKETLEEKYNRNHARLLPHQRLQGRRDNFHFFMLFLGCAIIPPAALLYLFVHFPKDKYSARHIPWDEYDSGLSDKLDIVFSLAGACLGSVFYYLLAK
tara:strand:- start:1750 stop:2052 length:303 start_codon:yes stop_codon:yes gene_type:complete